MANTNLSYLDNAMRASSKSLDHSQSASVQTGLNSQPATVGLGDNLAQIAAYQQQGEGQSLASVGEVLPSGSNAVQFAATNSAEQSGTLSTQSIVTTDGPALCVNALSGDDKLNMREAIYGLEIHGKSSQLAAGTLIDLTLDGKTFTGMVTDNAGNWELFLDSTDVEAIADGKHTLTFSAQDANGNTVAASRDLWMITHPGSEPQFIVNEVTQNDVSTENGIDYITLSGTLLGDFPIIAATLNPYDYPLYDFTVAEDGTWSVKVAQGDLATTDGYNMMLFTVADIAGNSYEVMEQVEIHLDPTLANSFSLAEGVSELDLALLGLNTEEMTEEASLSASVESKGSAALAEVNSESLTTAEGQLISLSTADGGVWNETAIRAPAGESEDNYAYGYASQDNTLADLLAQHNLQVQTT